MQIIEDINNLIELAKKGDLIDTKCISDTHHTFGELYYERMILFSLLCKTYPDNSFIAKKHFHDEDDPMFNGDFLAGIKTNDGVVTFHFKKEYLKYFDGIKLLENGPKWDKVGPIESIIRLNSLVDINKVKKKTKL